MARSNPPDRHFERRRKAALARVHLPSVEELLRGMAFFSNDVLGDAAEYASRLGGFIRRKSLVGYGPLLLALDDLAMSPAREQIHRLAKEFEALSDDALLPITEGRRRCGVYLAMFGDVSAAVSMARDIAPLALGDLRAGNRSDLMWQALGWLLHARHLENWLETRGQFSFPHKHHKREVTRYAEEVREAFEKASEPSPEAESKNEPEPRKVPDERLDPSVDEPGPPAVVVLQKLDKATNREGKDYLKEYREIVGVPLPLPILPDLAQVRSRLVAEFPHAVGVIDSILGGLAGRASTWIRPTILIGPAGCGKSRFAVRLAEELGLYFELVPCGGVADGMFGGNSRSWSSGMPSVPVSGEADVVFSVLPVSVDRLRRNANLDVQIATIPRTRIVKLNAASPFFDDVRERQAVSYAIDRTGIASVILRNRDLGASQLFPPSLSGWHQADMQPLTRDVERAKQLLAEAGWKPGADGILEQDGKRFSITLRTYSTWPELPPIATALQAQLRDAGIDLQVAVGNSSEIPARHQDGSLEAGLISRLYSIVPDAIGALRTDYSPGGSDWGAMGWDNSEMHELIVKLSETSDPAERAPLQRRAVEILQTELPSIPVTWSELAIVSNKRVANVVIDPLEVNYGLAGIRWAEDGQK